MAGRNNGHSTSPDSPRKKKRTPGDAKEFFQHLATLPRPGDHELTPALLEEILTPIAETGCHPATAAGRVGIPENVWKRWRAHGARDLAQGRDTLYAHLERGVVAAFNWAKIAYLEEIGADPMWQGKAWTLERIEPSNYGQRREVKVSHAMMPVWDPEKLTDTELDTLLALMRKSTPDDDDPGLNQRRRPLAELLPAEITGQAD